MTGLRRCVCSTVATVALIAFFAEPAFCASAIAVEAMSAANAIANMRRSRDFFMILALAVNTRSTVSARTLERFR